VTKRKIEQPQDIGPVTWVDMPNNLVYPRKILGNEN